MTQKEFLNRFKEATGAEAYHEGLTIEGQKVFKVKISDMKGYFNNYLVLRLQINSFHFEFNNNLRGFTTNLITE